jgi:hypothetical protein
VNHTSSLSYQSSMNDSSPLTTESLTVPSAKPMRRGSSTAKMTRSSASARRPLTRPSTRMVVPALTYGVPSASKRCSASVRLGATGVPSASKLTPEYMGPEAGRTSLSSRPAPRWAVHDSSASPAARTRASPLPMRHDSSAGMLRSGG